MPTTALGSNLPTPLDNATDGLWGEDNNDAHLVSHSEHVTKTVNQDFAKKELANTKHTTYFSKLQTQTGASGSVSIDAGSMVAHKLVLTGDVTLSITNIAGLPADSIIFLRLLIEQDATGGHSVTFPSIVKGTNGSTFQYGRTDANSHTKIQLESENAGVSWRASYINTWAS